MARSPSRKEKATTSAEDTSVDASMSIVSLPSTTSAASSQILPFATVKVADNNKHNDIGNDIGNSSSSHTPPPATNKGEKGNTKEAPSSKPEADKHVPATSSKSTKAQKWKKRVTANKKKKKLTASASPTTADAETTTDDSAVKNNNDRNNDNDQTLVEGHEAVEQVHAVELRCSSSPEKDEPHSKKEEYDEANDSAVSNDGNNDTDKDQIAVEGQHAAVEQAHAAELCCSSSPEKDEPQSKKQEYDEANDSAVSNDNYIGNGNNQELRSIEGQHAAAEEAHTVELRSSPPAKEEEPESRNEEDGEAVDAKARDAGRRNLDVDHKNKICASDEQQQQHSSNNNYDEGKSNKESSMDIALGFGRSSPAKEEPELKKEDNESTNSAEVEDVGGKFFDDNKSKISTSHNEYNNNYNEGKMNRESTRGDIALGFRCASPAKEEPELKKDGNGDEIVAAKAEDTGGSFLDDDTSKINTSHTEQHNSSNYGGDMNRESRGDIALGFRCSSPTKEEPELEKEDDESTDSAEVEDARGNFLDNNKSKISTSHTEQHNSNNCGGEINREHRRSIALGFGYSSPAKDKPKLRKEEGNEAEAEDARGKFLDDITSEIITSHTEITNKNDNYESKMNRESRRDIALGFEPAPGTHTNDHIGDEKGDLMHSMDHDDGDISLEELFSKAASLDVTLETESA